MSLPMDYGTNFGRNMVCAMLFDLLLLLNSVLLSAGNCGEGVSRIRLSSGDNGIIVNPVSGDKYEPNAKCTWYIEGSNDTSLIYLQFRSYDIECLWDRLFVYQGDSVHDTLLGSLTGSINQELPPVPQPLPLAAAEGSGSGTSSGAGTMDASPDHLVITVSGSSALVYFYSDSGAEEMGFNISYWINSCVENCSGNGVCDESTFTCQCDSSWTGLYCQLRACPNGCSRNGHCDNGRGQCVCDNGYTGHDCSLIEGSSHWVLLSDSESGMINRAGHTAIVWNSWLWVYGGYHYSKEDTDIESSGSGTDGLSADFIRYHINDKYWEKVPVQSSWLPRARYAHSAILYNDSLIIYGGALIKNEEITNELWQFDLNLLIWNQLNGSRNESTSTTHGNENIMFSSAESTTISSLLPLPVKDHSANIVGDVMYIIFGLSSTGGPLINYIQQYNITSNRWSVLPNRKDNTPTGRMGHTSVYSRSLDAFLVHGGGYSHGNSVSIRRDLLFYSLATNEWSFLTTSDNPAMFHSSVLINDGAMLSFGGHTSSHCFSQELQVYDILCNKWSTLSLPGLPTRAERFGHSGVVYEGSMLIFGGYNGIMFGEVLLLELKNCTVINNMEECVKETFCMWNKNQCTGLSLGTSPDHLQVSVNCTFDPCSIHHTCALCTSASGCLWSGDSCISNSTSFNATSASMVLVPSECPQSQASCDQFSSCFSCQIHDGCVWNVSECISSSSSSDPISSTSCDIPASCLQHSSCSECTQSICLWCGSTHKCIHHTLYPVLFPYGQCWSGWSDARRCPEESCSGYNTCDNCHGDPGCGWCRDPSDTGLGSCGEGGYLSPLQESFCSDDHWFYEQCPLCNCNGHSTCINKTICEECRNMTTGPNCEICQAGYYGNPVNGNNCTVCDCNGYNPVCNHVNGSCTCLDTGVTGDRCTRCDGLALYSGDASNFCYYQMSVGFIYTFSVTEERQKQTFYTAVPKSGDKLNVKFDITKNPFNAEIVVQFFIGRVSENYMLLVNLTDPIRTRGRSISKTFESFSAGGNSSNLFSFLKSSDRDANFSSLLASLTPNHYSKNMWNGDVGLVIYVYNQTTSLQYKITIDQNDLIFLVYFFVTFVVCFALLLTIFLLGWFIKRKIEVRAMMRAQRIELQRRVRRPFARLKAVVEKKPDLKAKQNASYVSVETCKSGKAAVLTLMIRLPCDRDTGHPSVNRTGIGFGSTLVRMNQSTKPKKVKTKNHRSADQSEEEHAT